MLKVALGHAEEIHTRAGVRMVIEQAQRQLRMVIEQAQRQLGTVHADAGIVLAGIEFDKSLAITPSDKSFSNRPRDDTSDC